MPTIVVPDIPATPDRRDAVLAALQKILPTTRAFDGCEGLELLVNQDDRANIVVYERWATRAHDTAQRALRAEMGFPARLRAPLPEPPGVRVFDIEGSWLEGSVWRGVGSMPVTPHRACPASGFALARLHPPLFRSN